MTDGYQSYAVFIYLCGSLQWRSSDLAIGFHSQNFSPTKMHRSIDLVNVTDALACANLPNKWNTLVYDLIPGVYAVSTTAVCTYIFFNNTTDIDLHFTNNTPKVEVNVIYAVFETNRDDLYIECHVKGLDTSNCKCISSIWFGSWYTELCEIHRVVNCFLKSAIFHRFLWHLPPPLSHSWSQGVESDSQRS